ncbi:jerky protein homolog-like [Lucilia sericata]|uniref:jerky protein homolog-like n=1 Tax=Lucilia sericata TaxID=13632 RepID=UPI0018A7F789|nr:jerky protein homolog-like [Lucilia sericata]
MPKRKRLLLKDKLKIIEEHEKGDCLVDLSFKYGLPKSSLCTIIKSKTKLLKDMEKTNFGSKHRRAMKEGEIPKMETELFKWFQDKRKMNVPISGPVLQTKALEIHKKFYSGQFNASHGWFSRFKKRYGIRLMKESGEKLSSKAELVEPFLLHFKDLLAQHSISKDAIFNADETGLLWKMLPDKTYVHSIKKKAPRRKMSKERVTVLLCANSSGTKKITPLMIGKSANPRAFRNKTLPIKYDHSKNAWMTSSIFKNWFFKIFVPEKNLPQKSVLILDNAPCHPPEDELVKETCDGKIWALYMPPNVTALIQPMDQNAIRLLKLHYKNSLLSKIIACDQENILEVLKRLNLYDVATMVAQSFKSVNENSLKKCWNKIFIPSVQHFDEEDEILLQRLLQTDEEVVSLSSGIQLLNQIFPNNNLTADDLNQWINDADTDFDENETSECEENEENDNPFVVDIKIKHTDVIKHLEECIKWGEQNNIDVSKKIVLREIQEEAIQRSLKLPQKQTSIKNYFK